MNMLDRFSARTHDVLATLYTARDGNHIDLVMTGKRLGNPWATGNNIEHSRRQTGFQRNLTQFERGERRLDRWLEDDGVAGSQGRANLPGRHHERIVPWS